jgi:protein-S-isoprenylcysteine O-methyltransferase Ste14
MTIEQTSDVAAGPSGIDTRSHLRSFVLPSFGTVLQPATILLLTRWRPAPLPLWRGVLGGAVLLAGLSLFAWTVRLFDRVGKGTLAYWKPPSRLVVVGPYAHVRNPMICGVVTIILGEAALFGSWWLAGWAALFLTINHIRYERSDEPKLAARFGAEYEEYRRNVPRWIPRIRPWTGR